MSQAGKKLYPCGHQEPLKALWKSVLFLSAMSRPSAPHEITEEDETAAVCAESPPLPVRAALSSGSACLKGTIGFFILNLEFSQRESRP